MKKINDNSDLRQDISLIKLNEPSQIIMHFAFYPDWRSKQNPTIYPKENYPIAEILDTDKIILLSEPMCPYFYMGNINDSDKITSIVSNFSGYVGIARNTTEIEVKNFIEHFIKLEEQYRCSYAKYKADNKSKDLTKSDQTIEVCISTGKSDNFISYLTIIKYICYSAIKMLGDKSELNVEMLTEVKYFYPNICELPGNLYFNTPKGYFILEENPPGQGSGVDVKELLLGDFSLGAID